MAVNRPIPLLRICDSCQRCFQHCFGEPPDCRFSLRREVCLTCSNAVVFIQGADPSLEPRASGGSVQ
jgi:hypothetical protein